jgi:endonuclease/exonuclease/phosphatase family metal-dependent hydrolase
MLKVLETPPRCLPTILGILFVASCSASDQPLGPDEDDVEVVQTGSFRVLTYNIQIAVFGTEFRTVRLPLIKESIEENRPDFIGFQEAYAANGSTQQSDLAAAFDGTAWTILRWDDLNTNNKNPIGLNTDRYALVASGVIVLDIVDGVGASGWQRYLDLHAAFHGEAGGRVHFLDEFRFLTWVVGEDRNSGERIVFLNCHYETYIGGFSGDANDQSRVDDFAEFTDVVNESFGWMSERIAEEAARLTSEYSADEAVIVGDFETGDVSLPAVSKYYDAGYVEAFFHLYPSPSARRTAQGIDNIYIKPDDVDILRAFYDTSYGRADSDHDPYYADFEIR